MSRTRRWLLAGCAAGMYAVSFFLDTCERLLVSDPDRYDGSEAFVAAWQGMIEWSPSEFKWWLWTAAWLVNPLIWLAIATAGLGYWRISGLSSAGAVCLSVPILWSFGRLVGLLPGYWDWIGSAVLLWGVSISQIRRRRKRRAIR